MTTEANKDNGWVEERPGLWSRPVDSEIQAQMPVEHTTFLNRTIGDHIRIKAAVFEENRRNFGLAHALFELLD